MIKKKNRVTGCPLSRKAIAEVHSLRQRKCHLPINKAISCDQYVTHIWQIHESLRSHEIIRVSQPLKWNFIWIKDTAMSKISDMDCINICATKMSTPRHFTAFCCRDTPNAPAWRPATEPQNTMFLFFNFQFIFLFCLFLFPSLSCWSNLKQIRFLKKKKKK